MTVYWLILLYFSVGTLIARDTLGGRDHRPFLIFGAVALILVIGFRYHVGGDWGAYNRMFSYAGEVSLEQILTREDAGYQLLNWLVQRVGADIWLVNLICAAAFVYGLNRLARTQHDPWLAYVAAVPYLIVVIAMGYTRQGVAIGILMAGLASLIRGGSMLRFMFYALVSAAFHKSAVFTIPMVLLGRGQSRFVNVIFVTAMTALAYRYFLSSSFDRLVNEYVRGGIDSEGAAIRVVMSVIPAVLFLLRQPAFGFAEGERRIWRNQAWVALAFLVGLFISPSSTTIDRLALYVAPMQIVIWNRIPKVYLSRELGRALVLMYSLAIMYVWLNFADNARYWIPYHIYPFLGG